jgi:cell division protein FtsW (lipid II flippase)
VTPTFQRQQSSQGWLSGANPIRQVDPVLLVAALALSLFGHVMIYSATAPRLEAAGGDPMHFVNRQGLSLGIALVAMAAVVLFDYRQFRAWAPVLYGISIVLLVLTAATGETVKAQRKDAGLSQVQLATRLGIVRVVASRAPAAGKEADRAHGRILGGKG